MNAKVKCIFQQRNVFLPFCSFYFFLEENDLFVEMRSFHFGRTKRRKEKLVFAHVFTDSKGKKSKT